MKKKLNQEEWQEIADQAYSAREELFILHRLSARSLPVSIVKHITKAINQLDSFKSEAEERMMSSGVSGDINIFYGSDSKIY